MNRQWVNGQETSNIHCHDRGLAYGDGVFSTIKVQHGQPLYWLEHKLRLQNSLQRLFIELDASFWNSVENVLDEACCGHHNIAIKIMVTRGNQRGYRASSKNSLNWILYQFNLPDYKKRYSKGVHLDIHHDFLHKNPRLSGIKHLNCLDYVLLSHTWKKERDDFILCDDEHFIIETSMANIAFIKNQTLVFPSHDQAGVAGIMRYKLMEAWLNLGGNVSLEPVHIERLDEFESSLMMNALMDIIPVLSIGKNSFLRYKSLKEINKFIKDV